MSSKVRTSVLFPALTALLPCAASAQAHRCRPASPAPIAGIPVNYDENKVGTDTLPAYAVALLGDVTHRKDSAVTGRAGGGDPAVGPGLTHKTERKEKSARRRDDGGRFLLPSKVTCRTSSSSLR
jgi:hypothetical protein